MSEIQRPWAFEHSVECNVPLEFAWTFWTNVQNWALDADVESLEIDGPFEAGSSGVTHSKSSGKIEWRIVKVDGYRAVIEFPLSDAIGRFVWMFHSVDEGCRITQHCTIEGKQADMYADAIAPSLEVGIPAGMRKLCDAIESSHQRAI